MTTTFFPSPSLIANGLTIILCLAVLIQSARMMRNLKAVNVSQMGTVVLGLDHATVQARKVLGDLKIALAEEGAQNARVVAEGDALRDELRMLIEIADNMASRLADAPKPQAVQTPPAAAAPVQQAPAAKAVKGNRDRDLESLCALIADYRRARSAGQGRAPEGPADLNSARLHEAQYAQVREAA